MAVDPQLGLDNYNRQRILTEQQTIVYNILAILFGKPGFYPSIPSLGMYIQHYLYNFEDEINTDIIKAELVQQCTDFRLNVNDGSFDVFVTQINGEPVIIFKLPVIVAKQTSELVLGVTINDAGNYKFNFVFNKLQYI